MNLKQKIVDVGGLFFEDLLFDRLTLKIGARHPVCQQALGFREILAGHKVVG